MTVLHNTYVVPMYTTQCVLYTVYCTESKLWSINSKKTKKCNLVLTVGGEGRGRDVSHPLAPC